MKTKIILPLFTVIGAAFISGCVTTDTHVVQPGDKPIVSYRINIQDYAAVANDAINKLLASGKLDKVSTPPAVLFVSSIIDNTGQQIDADLLTTKISIALQNSGGKAVTT